MPYCNTFPSPSPLYLSTLTIKLVQSRSLSRAVGDLAHLASLRRLLRRLLPLREMHILGHGQCVIESEGRRKHLHRRRLELRIAVCLWQKIGRFRRLAFLGLLELGD